MIKQRNQFLGITKLGEKGQVVIPAEARTRMKLKKGERLIVMNPHGNALVLMKASYFEDFTKTVTKHLASIKTSLKLKPKS